jgi:integrase
MRAWNKLSAAFVRNVDREGLYGDGGNLYLQITNGGKSWIFQYQRHGCSRYMGLGSVRHVSLALARELRDACHEQLARGLDPIDVRNGAVLAARAERAKELTFQQCAEDYLEVNASRWRNAKHRKQWEATLTQYAYPLLGNLAVAAIDSGLVFEVLKPLVTTKPVTASRLRGRIETVLDFAKAANRREGDNPADKAVIGHLLPLRSEKAAVEHQPALPFAKVPEFMAALRATPGTAARMLEMIILSGMRFDAVRPAVCGEFHLGPPAPVPVWVIPAARMKNLGRDHNVPLVGRALELARELTAGRKPDAPVFGGAKAISPNAVRQRVLPDVLKAIGHEDRVVTHGFRSCLKDWAHEITNIRTEVIEQALGHRIKSTVERSYRRGDLFTKRRGLMVAWDRYCSGPAVAGATVTRLPVAR